MPDTVECPRCHSVTRGSLEPLGDGLACATCRLNASLPPEPPSVEVPDLED